MIQLLSLLQMTRKGLNVGLVKMFVTLSYISLDNIFIRFGTKLHRQIVGIPMGTNCAPLGADLFYSS